MKKEISKRDFYTQQAKKEGYPARSVYKLQEIDNKFRLFRPGFFVLDLGCAPGSWLLYISGAVGPLGRVFGVDKDNLKIRLPFNATFLQKDIFDADLIEMLGNFGRFNCVVSDLAPKISGIKDVDHYNSSLLCFRALEIAQKILMKEESALLRANEFRLSDKADLRKKENYFSAEKQSSHSSFVCKVLESPQTAHFIKQVKRNFLFVKSFKPKASKRFSKEFFVVAKGFKG